VHVVGDVVGEIRDGVEQAGELINSGFNYVGNVAEQGRHTVVNLLGV